MKRYRIPAVLLALMLLVSFCTACTQSGEDAQTAAGVSTGDTSSETNESTASENRAAGGTSTKTGTTVQASQLSYTASEQDSKTEWDEDAVQVTLADSGIAVQGNGAKVNGSIVTISAPGTYVLGGTLSNGQIVIDAAKTAKVQLILNGVTIANKSGAPIYASAADDVTITLSAGTTNSLTDGASDFAYADKVNEEPDAALFAKCDLTMNGTGKLVVNAGFNNGIGTKDDLLLVSGSYEITAANHAIRGRDSVTILDGSYILSAGSDGIQANNDEDGTKGWILLQGGTFRINSVHDGIQAETALTVKGGKYTITAGGGHTNSQAAEESFKGIKAAADILISGGGLTVDSRDDSIHSNGNISITGGTLTLSSADDGIHADDTVTIENGSIRIATSYEGVEGAQVNMNGGTLDINASDDGINAAGGSGNGTDGGMGGRFGRDSFASGGGNYSLHVTGGEITLNAGGDGLDSNGSITIAGGKLEVIINSTPDNGALDCDGTLTLTGGNVIYGGSGLESSPGDSSTQSYVYAENVPAAAHVTVMKDGKTLISYTAAKALTYLALSAPGISKGESYTVSIGDSESTITAGTGGGHSMGGPGGNQGGFGWW